MGSILLCRAAIHSRPYFNLFFFVFPYANYVLFLGGRLRWFLMLTWVIEDPLSPSDLVQGPIMNGKYDEQPAQLDSMSFSAENTCRVPRGVHWYVKRIHVLWLNSSAKPKPSRALTKYRSCRCYKCCGRIPNQNTCIVVSHPRALSDSSEMRGVQRRGIGMVSPPSVGALLS